MKPENFSWNHLYFHEKFREIGFTKKLGFHMGHPVLVINIRIILKYILLISSIFSESASRDRNWSNVWKIWKSCHDKTASSIQSNQLSSAILTSRRKKNNHIFINNIHNYFFKRKRNSFAQHKTKRHPKIVMRTIQRKVCVKTSTL